MKEMWHDSVGAMMRQLSGGQIIRHKKLKCFGRGESQIEAMLPEGFLRQTDPVVGITASQATITLRIAAQGPDDAACQAKMAPVIAAIRQRLGNLIFGEDEEELEHATVKLLLKRRRTLATAEWGTAGLVANWLGALPEAQACYRGGIVGRDAKTLAEALGISAATLPLPSPGMVEFTQHMALAARRRFHADYALAVSEFPPFDPQADEPKPFFLALAGPSHMVIREIPYAGHPAIIRVLCGKNALNLVRLTLLEAQD
jgi:nicotinamide-nucleotide amidase